MILTFVQNFSKMNSHCLKWLWNRLAKHNCMIKNTILRRDVSIESQEIWADPRDTLPTAMLFFNAKLHMYFEQKILSWPKNSINSQNWQFIDMRVQLVSHGTGPKLNWVLNGLQMSSHLLQMIFRDDKFLWTERIGESPTLRPLRAAVTHKALVQKGTSLTLP